MTSQCELEIIIPRNQSQHRRQSRRGRRIQRKQNRSCSCQKHEQPQTPDPQAQQPSRGQYQLQSKPQSQPVGYRPQIEPQSRRKQQRPYTKSMEKQVDEATRRLSQQGFRSQQLMDVAQSRSASDQASSHDTESQKSIPYVLGSCDIPWISAQLGSGKPSSEPDTDYELLDFDGSRSPSIVSFNSDSDESIVMIGNWKATEGDGSWW